MVEQSAGKKLSGARQAKGLSIDAAAHATKMRPDKILALENDDFSRFGSSAYAKGFLLMYSRYLNVDVATELQDLHSASHRVNLREYQYLNNAPTPKEQNLQPLHRRKPKPPSILPLLAFVAACVLGGGYLYVREYIHRLGLDKPSEAQTVELVAAQPEKTTPAAAETPAAEPEPAAPEPAVTPEPIAAASEPAAQPAPAAPAAPPAAVPQENELSVESLKKTYVTIRRDRNSPALFEDYVYPNGKLLKVRGTTFFIEVKDETAVQIRKNGHPIAYQAPGVAVE